MKRWRKSNQRLAARIKESDDPIEKQQLRSRMVTKRQVHTMQRFIPGDNPSNLLMALFARVGLVNR